MLIFRDPQEADQEVARYRATFKHLQVRCGSLGNNLQDRKIRGIETSLYSGYAHVECPLLSAIGCHHGIRFLLSVST